VIGWPCAAGFVAGARQRASDRWAAGGQSLLRRPNNKLACSFSIDVTPAPILHRSIYTNTGVHTHQLPGSNPADIQLSPSAVRLPSRQLCPQVRERSLLGCRRHFTPARCTSCVCERGIALCRACCPANRPALLLLLLLLRRRWWSWWWLHDAAESWIITQSQLLLCSCTNRRLVLMLITLLPCLLPRLNLPLSCRCPGVLSSNGGAPPAVHSECIAMHCSAKGAEAAAKGAATGGGPATEGACARDGARTAACQICGVEPRGAARINGSGGCSSGWLPGHHSGLCPTLRFCWWL